MIPRILVLAVCLAGAPAPSARPHPNISLEQVETALRNAGSGRPSLLLTEARLSRVLEMVERDPLLEAVSAAIVVGADRLVGREPLERVVTGRRLLSVSREYLRRMVWLGTAHQLTGDDKFIRQAETEMLAAAAFSDWNPSHFLDTAEMTAALGLGYDWFHRVLSEESKRRIREAIVTKGLEPSFHHDGWTRARHNWNQVCNGGLALGALALREEEPELAARVVHRAVTTVQPAMDEYEPDGAYPEGPSYWSYGTTYNVVLIDALESVLGTDFGLSRRSGFAGSADYYLHVTGPGGLYFNYSDCGPGGVFNPAVFWFARRYGKPYVAYHQLRRIGADGANGRAVLTEALTGRFAPLAILWGSSEVAVPPRLHWMGRGTTPVAMLRSSWTDEDAAYLALKGGTPSANHGHMDIGSFIYEADGVRWALDLGMQSYHAMEERGLNIWNRSQDSDRWRIFRYNNFSHNTLVVDGRLQNVEGFGPLSRFSDEGPSPHAVVDLSDVYDGQLEKALRGVTLFEDRRALIQDEWRAGDRPATVRWGMVAPGSVEFLSATAARLTESGATLLFEVHAPREIRLRTYSTDPPAEWDEANPNTYILGFEVALQPNEELRLAVILTPGDAEGLVPPPLSPLLEWSAALE
jgi:hypothetical protein